MERTFQLVHQERVQVVNQEKRWAKANLFLPVGWLAGVGDGSVGALCEGLEDSVQGGALMAGGMPAIPGMQAGMPALPGVEFGSLEELQPHEGDYIYPVFRALSAAVIPGYWLDYTRPGVLENSAALLQGQTVYKNHDFFDVEQWLGVVTSSFWDAEGAQSEGVPGINVELKIDWKMNPRIARGLLMQPPAIHSASVTVLFEFDYSHAELADEGRFWDLLGEEVNGERVRLIVTKILGYWEISLVFQGADQLAKRMSFEAGSSSTPLTRATVGRGGDENSETNRMQLTAEMKATLGLGENAQAEVPEATVHEAIRRLARLAAAGETMIDKARAEALRLARLAEGDAQAGDLRLPIEELINDATPEQLETITRVYTERAALKFPHTCQVCGTPSRTSRSSLEPALEETRARVTNVVNSLH
jgi:hypothetical protein